MKKGLIGFYDYTVVLTYCGMISALIGIFFAFEGGFLPAMLCLMAAGLCDCFDGAVARTKARGEEEKCFGIQIDSLCDLISFGVLPGMIVYCLLDRSIAAAAVCILFVLCALIRLAYFNVQEARRQKETDGHRTSYLGLPVTTIAMLLPWVYDFYYLNVIPFRQVFPVLLVVVAGCFVAPFQVPKPHGRKKLPLTVWGLLELGFTIFLLVRA